MTFKRFAFRDSFSAIWSVPLPSVFVLRLRRFRPPQRGPSHFLLLVQEKVTKEKDTPVPRLILRPCKIRCARRLRGLSTGHPWPDDKLARIPARDPSGYPPPPRRGTGAPLKSRSARFLRARAERRSLCFAVALGAPCEAAPGGWIARSVARMDARKFVVRTGTCCRQTPPARSFPSTEG